MSVLVDVLTDEPTSAQVNLKHVHTRAREPLGFGSQRVLNIAASHRSPRQLSALRQAWCFIFQYSILPVQLVKLNGIDLWALPFLDCIALLDAQFEHAPFQLFGTGLTDLRLSSLL